jgi:hypothetical protein
MKLHRWTIWAQLGLSKLPLLVLVLPVMLASALTARAQDVVAQPPTNPVVPIALQQAQAAENIVPSESVPAFAPDTPLLEWGPTTLRAHLSYQYLYGDGIPAASGEHFTTSIHNVSPEVLVDLGTHWTVDYVPTWVFYSNPAFQDTVDQSIRLAGWGSYEDWILRLSQSYNSSSSPTIETGRQTKEVSSSTSLDATYSLNSKLGLQLTAMEAYLSAESFTSSHEWSTTDWLHYKMAPQLDTAVGLGLGYVDVSQGVDSTYSRPEAQVTWNPTQKITLNIQGGFENRQARGTGTSGQNNPIFAASIQYQPFETTTLGLSALREVSTSVLENQLAKTNGWSATLQQRLLEKFYLSAALSHQKVAYVSLEGGVGALRNDDSYSINLRLSTVLFRRCTVAAIYQNTRNSSGVAGFGLSSRQAGFEVSYRF